MLPSQSTKTDNRGASLMSLAGSPELQLSRSASRVASVTEQNSVIASLVLAFSDDPAARWLFPDPHQYLTYFPQFVIALAGKAFEQGTAYMGEGYAGAALWLAAGVEPDSETLGELLQGCLLEASQPDAFAVFEQMDNHHPHYPHWYLPVLGVEPRHQGRGHGSELLRRVLTQCDRHDLPAYLESSNPQNVPFYQRHGFRVTGTIQAGTSPQILPMLRQPNSST